MAPTPLTIRQCEEAIDAFLRTHAGNVHRDDVGPLFGQLALLRNQTWPDAATRKYWSEAASAALSDDPRESQSRTVRWTYAVASAAGTPRQSSRTRFMPASHARLRASIRATRRPGR